VAIKYHAPRGTNDLVYPESDKVRSLLEVAREVLELHGYQRIDTPILESTELFTEHRRGHRHSEQRDVHLRGPGR